MIESETQLVFGIYSLYHINVSVIQENTRFLFTFKGQLDVFKDSNC